MTDEVQMEMAYACVAGNLDIDLTNATLARKTGEMVHFMVTQKKQPQYRKFCAALHRLEIYQGYVFSGSGRSHNKNNTKLALTHLRTADKG